MPAHADGTGKSGKQSARGRPDRHARQHGVGMIEVLVAIVITSLALLGLAGLQINSLRFQKISHYRAIAMQHCQDLGERVRANMAGAIGGFYTAHESNYASGAGEPTRCADANSCTPAEVAKNDLHGWRASLARNMAGGWGEISGTATGGFTIKVYYKEPDKNDGALDPKCTQSALSSQDTDVRCMTMVLVP